MFRKVTVLDETLTVGGDIELFQRKQADKLTWINRNVGEI